MGDGCVPTNRANAEHYQWGGPQGTDCDGWHLVRTPELSVIEERMPASSEEVRHAHRRARQFFYLLAGELTMEVEGREHTLLCGDGLEVAPGWWHQAMNRSGEEVRFVVVSQPPSHGDRITEATAGTTATTGE